MTNVDIRALAKLSRLEVSDEEVGKLEQELPGILSFVETIQKVSAIEETKGEGLRNVLREDENPHESGLYTDALLNAAPAQKNGRIVVKQVISRSKGSPSWKK